MSTPLVSVNMCVWRPHEVYFPQAVRSILDQTFEDFELIIVEDPSEIDGRAMIADLLGDPRIRYVQNPTRTGLVSQRNQALQLSRADLVAVLDADDVAKPHRLATQIEYCTSHPDVSVLGSWLEIINSNGHPIGLRRYPTEHKLIAKTFRRYNPIAQPAVLFRRELAQSVGAYRGEMYVEDFDLWCRMFKAGAHFANIPEPLTSYRVHSASGTKASHIRHVLQNTIRIKREYFGQEMNLGDRLRLYGEICLTLLPPRLVLFLFQKLTFKSIPKRKPCR